MAKQFVVLKAIESGDVFWSTNNDRNPERMADGSIAYKVVDYADTEEEAISIWKREQSKSPLAALFGK